MKKSRKGSHIGMVLSFTLFVIFLAFLYSALEPAIERKSNKQFVLDNLQIELIEKVSANLTKVSISSPLEEVCLKIYDENVSIASGLNSTVKDNESKIVESKREGNYLLVRNNTFWIYYSEEEFEPNVAEFTNCVEPTIESIISNKEVFEAKIIGVENSYQTDYEGLKNELGIPDGNGFDFSFTFNNGTTIGSERDTLAEIYAKEIPVQYVDKKANILSGSFIIRVW